jgi:hypothetical protein
LYKNLIKIGVAAIAKIKPSDVSVKIFVKAEVGIVFVFYHKNGNSPNKCNIAKKVIDGLYLELNSNSGYQKKSPGNSFRPLTLLEALFNNGF